MKTDLFRFLYQRSEVKLNRKVFVFAICLVISFFTWLQINLSKEHVDNLPLKFDFINLPKAKFGTIKISDTLFIEVESDGYSLLKYEMKDISIDFKKLKKDHNSGTFIFLPNNYTKTIAKQMGENFKVLRALTDTVQLNPLHK